jgi:hypothetical protein
MLSRCSFSISRFHKHFCKKNFFPAIFTPLPGNTTYGKRKKREQQTAARIVRELSHLLQMTYIMLKRAVQPQFCAFRKMIFRIP